MKFNPLGRIVKNNDPIESKFLLSLFVVSAISVFVFAAATTVKARNGEKTVTFARTIEPPLKITEIKVGQRTRAFDESFEAEADWIKNLSFKLENISGKPIVYLNVNVNFPEPRATGNLMSYTVSLGRRPDSKLKQNNAPLMLGAGETTDVLLEKEKDRIYKFVNERQPFETIEKIELEIGFVIFADKTAWWAGSFMRQDPEHPDRYNPVPPR